MKTLYLTFSLVVLYATAQSQEWTNLNSGTSNHLIGLDFISENEGWAVGGSGTILHTIDGGETWDTQTSGTSTALYAIDFINEMNGWVVGDGSTIKKTTNGGETWTTVNAGVTADFRTIFFLNASIGFIGGGINQTQATLLRTTNGGETWSPLDTETTHVLYGIYFTDALNGCVSGNGGDILRTTDGGLNWSDESSAESGIIDCVHFTVAGIGYASGENGALLRTYDQGDNWDQLDIDGTTDRLISVNFCDPYTGFAVGGNVGSDDGRIYRTNNMGESWEVVAEADHLLYESVFPTATTGYACGRNGILMKIQNIVNSVIEQPVASEQDPMQVLVYPNPTKDILNIRLDNQNNTLVQITLFDAVGNLQIATYNKSLANGESQITLEEFSELVTGIYMVVVRVGNQQQTSRVVKI